MRLHALYSKSSVNILREYLEDLRELHQQFKRPSLLSEAKITITIDDDKEKNGIPQEAREVFINRAKDIGKFDDPEWLSHLLNGMKQAGVQGFNKIQEDEKPVSNKDIRQLIGLLIDLVSYS